MPRNLSSDVITILESGKLSPAYLVDIQLTGGVAHLWTGLGTITWGGHDYLGVGALGTVSQIGDTSNVEAQNITLVLDGVGSSNLSLVLGQVKQSYTCKVYLAFIASDGSIVADPAVAFNGSIDTMNIQEGAETSTISITVENALIDLQRATGRRYTHEDQQFSFPGDLGFIYVAAIQDWSGIWGKPGNQNGSLSGSTGGNSGGTGGGSSGSGIGRSPQRNNQK